MKTLEYKYSEVEKIDLVKGTITGIDNASPFFNSWWRALRTNEEGEVDSSIDGKILEDSIAVWMENSKVNQNQANYLNYNFMFKPFQISNNEINRFTSLYDLGTFAPKLYLEKEYSDSQKKLNGKYIFIPYREIKDTEIEITDDELMTYYNSNLDDYLNDNKTRIIDYYYFESKPSIDDVDKAKNQIIAQVNNNLKNFQALISDTTNSSKGLLDYVREKSVIKSSVELEKKSSAEINQYKNNLINELGESFFGPIVEDDIVKIGIIINQYKDSVDVVFLNKDIYLDDNTTEKTLEELKILHFLTRHLKNLKIVQKNSKM